MHRFRPFAAASAILAVVGLVGLGPAAHAASRPAVTVSTPQVTGTSATIGLLVNRAPHAIAALVCSLTDGPERTGHLFDRGVDSRPRHQEDRDVPGDAGRPRSVTTGSRSPSR